MSCIMINGATGAILIDATLITTDDGNKDRWGTLSMNAAGHLVVVWHNNGLLTTTELFMQVLDPSLAAQDGTATTLAAIQTLAATSLTADDGFKSAHAMSAIDASGRLHVVWLDAIDGSLPRNGGTPYEMLVDPATANVLSTRPLDASTSGSFTNFHYAGISKDAAKVVWGPPGNLIRLASTGSDPAFFPPGAVASSGTISIRPRDVTALPPAAAASAPSAFADGFNEVVIDGIANGATVTVTLTFPRNIPAGAPYHKWDVNNGWFTIPVGSNDGDNVITITLTDGGAGDADGIANGQIVDPGGPGTGSSGSSGSSGALANDNCFLMILPAGQSPWGLAIVPLLLAGIWLARRRRG
ncbi:MAG: choice-of-anchor U domain-containing protein [Mariprofundaceae bacterium]